MGEYIVAVDLGTGSCKTVVVDNNAKVIASAQAEYSSAYPQPGWVEQNPQDWLSAVGITIRESLNRGRIKPEEVKALGLVGVTHNAVLLDECWQPLRPCILYLDTRSQAECDQLLEKWGDEIFSRTLNTISPIWTWPQLLWVEKNEPGIWASVDHILFQKDYIRHQIAPSPVTDLIDVEGTLLFDPIKNDWIPEFFNSLGLRSTVLPEICRPTETVGVIDAKGADLTGLRVGTPVVAGTTDTAAEVFGAGALKPGQGTVKLASVGRITCVTTQPILDRHILNYRHVLDRLWYPGTATKYASASFRWLRDSIWQHASFAEMDYEAGRIPAGCHGLIFHPHLQGEWVPYWDTKMRGDFIGLTMRHGLPHMARAVMEGVAFSLRAGMEFAQDWGLPFDEISLIGGGSVSNSWMQIIANVLKRPIRIPLNREAAYGAALITGMGVGMFSSDANDILALISY